MPLAITLRLDPVSATSIEDIWQTLATEDIDVEPDRLGYAPHITLAIYPDNVPLDALQTAIAKVTAGRRALPVTLSGIGIFPGPSSILWAAPVVTRDLLALHAALAEALPGLPVHRYYRSDAWVPHVTLTAPIPNPASALRTLLPPWRPISGALIQADLVRFPPIGVLQSHTLVN